MNFFLQNSQPAFFLQVLEYSQQHITQKDQTFGWESG